jgi:hypothetical protein
MTNLILVKITNSENVDCDPIFEASCSSSEPHLLIQEDSNDLVRDFNLSKKQAGLLGSILKGWNLLHQNNEIHFFPHRQHGFEEFLSQEIDLIF